MSNYSHLRAAVVAVSLIVASACGPDAVFRVVHPAAIPTDNYGNAYSLGAFDGVSPQAVGTYRQLVMQSVQRTINPAIHLGNGEGLIISATVDVDSFETSEHREDAVCNCAYSNGVNPQGQRQYIYQNTPCIALVRDALGTSSVTFTVTDSQSGGAVFSQTYTASNRWSERALSANCENAPPNDQYRARQAPMIGRQVISQLYSQNMASFERVILPWAENVAGGRTIRRPASAARPHCLDMSDLARYGSRDPPLHLQV